MTLTLPEIRNRVEAVRRKDNYRDARRFGIRSHEPWTGATEARIDEQPSRIVQVDSVLQAREALRSAPDDGILVLVTSLSEQELGLDVMARLARHRLEDLLPWDAVKSLFKVNEIDPRVARQPWMAEVLLKSAPPEGYQPIPSGLLDLDSVWEVLLRALGFVGVRPDLRSVLETVSGESFAGRYRSIDARFRQRVPERLAESAGPVARLIMSVADAGRESDVVPIGLVLATLYDEVLSNDSSATEPRVRVDVALDLKIAPAEAKGWGDAAIALVGELRGLQQPVDGILRRAEELLREWHGEQFAWASDLLPLGFEQRLDRFAEALGAAVRSLPEADPSGAEAALAAVERHRLARRGEPGEDRVGRSRMAVRLLRWLACEVPKPPATLGEAAGRYASESSFVDWARQVLADGEGHAALSRLYLQILDRATARREKENEAFAKALAHWTESADHAGPILPVENILARVVAPVASREKVLLLVLDGLSVPIFHRLAEDLEREGWRLSAPNDGRLPPAIATLPSVTQVSRASLLAGTLTMGGQDVERDGFEGHAALQSVGGRGKPKLFHKAELSRRSGDELSQDLHKAVEGDARVVAAVINVIDDQLDRGDQLRPDWSIASIPVLERLLFRARANRRVVIMASDHGHVVESDMTLVGAEGPAHDRYRVPGGKTKEGEMVFRGSRVLVPEGGNSVVLPWSERLRYGRKAAGYHGGASPQEVVAPLAVFLTGAMELEGWRPLPLERPAWWDKTAALPSLDLPVRLPDEAPPSKVATKKPKAEEESLFAPGPAVAARPKWVGELLECSLYAEQKQMIRKPLGDEELARLLVTLDAAGGSLTMLGLAARLNETPMRLTGLLMAASRVLNVDGYGVLESDAAAQTVRLDRKLLATQFQLQGGAEAC